MSRAVGILAFIVLLCSGAFAQILHITDERGAALVGVQVFSPEQVFTAISDQAGEVSLADWDGTSLLQFSYLGYTPARYTPAQLAKAKYRIQLEPGISQLSAVEVIGRRNEQAHKMSYRLERIDASDINLRQSATTADALLQAGVFVQKSQLGGGSPILRGFEANRVLLVVDGVRMNNAIYRSGHLQNAISIDESGLAATEVIFGPGSLTYGSDALGGVIHFRSRTPAFLAEGLQKNQWQTVYHARFGTAANEYTGHLRLEGRAKRWTSLSSISYSRFGDLRAGSRYPADVHRFGDRTEYVITRGGEDEIVRNPQPLRQVGSAYRQFDLLQKIAFAAGANWTLGLNLQWSTTSDVPRYDQLRERRDGVLRFAEWYYGPQMRTLLALRADGQLQQPWADQVSVIWSAQYLAEDRYERTFASPVGESSLVDVYVYNATIDFTKKLGDRQNLLYGVDWSHNDVRSVAYLQNFRTGERVAGAVSRYPSQGSGLDAIGAYAQYRWQNPDSVWRAEAGVRYSLQRLQTRFGEQDPIDWPADFVSGLHNQSEALTWSAALRWQPGQWAFRFLAATAFRAPNIDDFAKFREKGGFVQVPNPDLSPEKSLTYEATLARTIGGAQLSSTIFYTRLRDAIVRQDHPLPDGRTTFVSRGETFFTQANVNTEEAQIWGWSAQMQWPFHTHLTWRAGLTYTRGRRQFPLSEAQSIQVPLDHIPPWYGQSALRYRNQRWEAELLWIWQGAKKAEDYGVTDILMASDGLQFIREGSSDNIEQGVIDPTTGAYLGVYGWQTWNMYLKYRFRTSLYLQLGLENIFDRHYRSFASGISGPGRNVLVGVRGEF